MPIHDWTRVPSGLFHHFHQAWSMRIVDALNSGRLPKGTSALVEQCSGPKESDVLAVESRSRRPKFDSGGSAGGLAMKTKPVARFVQRSTGELYSRRANRIVVKHHLGRTIAVIEIVSPGNKDSQRSLREFVDKTVDFLRAGIHVLVIDLFPPTARDPSGIHKAIWDEMHAEEFSLPEGQDRTLVSYEVGDVRVAYIEPVGVGESLPEMPLFLTNDDHVMVPLEATYRSTWDAAPEEFRIAVETGVVPDPDADTE